MSKLSPVANRFLRYITFDTQSQEDSSTYPSTEKQKELGRHLVQELHDLGLDDASMNEHGYVMATIESTVDNPNVPVIGFIAHMDTSPEVSGKDVKAVIHYNYPGGPLRLSEKHVLTPEECAPLNENVGRTLISSDGSTLLGADNKAGIAEIMTMAERLKKDRNIQHGKIRIAFTVDEEVGGGTKFFDVKQFGAAYAYTVDGGGTPGEIENETFSADSAKVTFVGRNVHPGYAKDKMVSAIKAASYFVELLPRDKAPETTEDRQGFLHPVSLGASVESATVKLILRSFDTEELTLQRELVNSLAAKVKDRFAGVGANVEFEESYRNMRLVLDQHPKVVELGMEAIRRVGITPVLNRVRGGTDGSKLSFMGLPTANLFAGGHLFHSRFEWVAVEVMDMAVDTLVNLAVLWSEQ